MCASLDLQLLAFKFSSIRKELDDTAPLFRMLASKEPDTIEIRAAGSILQSIYNGMEAVLFLFLDKAEVQESSSWHRDLVDRAFEKIELSDDMRLRLEILRKFRHKYRHAYGFMLDWALMRDLFLSLPDLAATFEAAIERYVKTI